jgi:ATP-dependent RNA helicase DDX52/ROK1
MKSAAEVQEDFQAELKPFFIFCFQNFLSMDIFQTLNFGTTFKRKDKRLEEKKEKQVLVEFDESVADLPQELDFFGQEEKQESAPKKVRSSVVFKAAEKLESEEDVKRFRKENRIKVYNEDDRLVAKPVTGWKDYLDTQRIPPSFKRGIESLNFPNMTPIQMQAIPIICEKRELIACAPTGSGKTLAFIVPILQKLKKPAESNFRALIITPTRELASQIYREIIKLTGEKFRMCVLSQSHLESKELVTSDSWDILISTPLRLIHGVNDGLVKVSK